MNTLAKFIAAMLIFGTNGLLARRISLGGAEIVLLRTLLGSCFLIGLGLLRRDLRLVGLRADKVPATLGGAALGLNWVCLFIAYQTAGVSLSTLVYYCGPMLVLALSPLLFREKLTWNKIAAIAAVALGMIFISGEIERGSDLAVGLLWAAGAAGFYALVIIANKRVQHLSGIHCAMYELIVSFFVVLAFLAVTGARLPVIPAGSELPWVLVLGLVNTGLAYYLYFSAMQRLSGQTVALLCYIDPLTALVLSALVLHERLLPLQIAGAALILGGACLGELRLRRRGA